MQLGNDRLHTNHGALVPDRLDSVTVTGDKFELPISNNLLAEINEIKHDVTLGVPKTPLVGTNC